MSSLTPRIDENTKMIIYLAQSPSGKCYIGKTIKSLKHRRMMHYATANKYNTPFARALRKYGNDIIWTILSVGSSNVELCILEKQYIEKYDTYNNGYNCTFGGEGHSGFKQSVESIKKRTVKTKKALTGRKLSESHIEALSKGHKGLTSGMKGKIQSDITKQKISKYQNFRVKSIICNETGQEFKNSREVAAIMGIDRSNLIKHLKMQKSYLRIKGYTFKYKSEVSDV